MLNGGIDIVSGLIVLPSAGRGGSGSKDRVIYSAMGIVLLSRGSLSVGCL